MGMGEKTPKKKRQKEKRERKKWVDYSQILYLYGKSSLCIENRDDTTITCKAGKALQGTTPWDQAFNQQLPTWHKRQVDLPGGK